MGQQVGIWVDYNADFLLKRNQYSSQIPQKKHFKIKFSGYLFKEVMNTVCVI